MSVFDPECGIDMMDTLLTEDMLEKLNYFIKAQKIKRKKLQAEGISKAKDYSEGILSFLFLSHFLQYPFLLIIKKLLSCRIPFTLITSVDKQKTTECHKQKNNYPQYPNHILIPAFHNRRTPPLSIL